MKSIHGERRGNKQNPGLWISLTLRHSGQDHGYGCLLIRDMLASSQDSATKCQTLLIKNRSSILGLIETAMIVEPECLGQGGKIKGKSKMRYRRWGGRRGWSRASVGFHVHQTAWALARPRQALWPCSGIPTPRGRGFLVHKIREWMIISPCRWGESWGMRWCTESISKYLFFTWFLICSKR